MTPNNISIAFSDYAIPEFKESSSSGSKWVNYGMDNLYPDYLLHLYRRSPKHGSIVRNKASYILGRGFKFKEEGGNEELLNVVNQDRESLNKVGKKCAIDLSVYGGFYLSITWNKGKSIGDMYHVDYHKVRSNKDNTEFFIKPNGWKDTSGKNKEEIYLAFNPETPSGTQILYYKEYTPGLDTYTLPEYIQGLNYAEADALISEHTLSNAKTGFTASKMVNFFNGAPTEEQKREVERQFLKKYSGEKGSKIIMSFNDDPSRAPTVLDLGVSDLTKEDFQQVDNLITQNLFSVHQVTSPMLFGIRVPGQLGGRSELVDAYEIYKNTYVDDKQEAVAEVFNEVNKFRGCPEVVMIPKEPIGMDVLSNANLLAMLPKEWIYEKIGINPADFPELQTPEATTEITPDAPVEAQVVNEAIKGLTGRQHQQLLRIIRQFTKGQLTRDQALTMMRAGYGLSDEEILMMLGETDTEDLQFSDDLLLSYFAEMGEPAENYEVIRSMKSSIFSDADADAHEMFAFAEISQLESNILDLIRKDKRITPEALAKVLKSSVPMVEKIINELETKGYLATKVVKVGIDKQTERTTTKEVAKIIKEKTPLTKEVFIRYSYEGPKDKATNREFCWRLMDLDKVWSRADIETISGRVGYSVWERRGGFYHNPNTKETTPYCRHKWTPLIVIKKKK
jgi:DNA-binding MarR family transcriptional regulator